MTEGEPTEPQPFHGRHTAGQRLVLVINCIIVLLCFAGAVGLLIGKHAGEKGRKVEINTPPRGQASGSPRGLQVTAAPGETLPPEDSGSPETFPEADPEAM